MTDARRAARVEEIKLRHGNHLRNTGMCEQCDLLDLLAERGAALARKQALIDGLRGDLDVHRRELERLRERALAPHVAPTQEPA